MPTFKVGELVQLKSGGPVVTVRAVAYQLDGDNKEFVQCDWFEESRRMQGPFVPETLQIPAATRRGAQKIS